MFNKTKKALMAALLSTAMFAEAQVATRLQFPNPGQHVYFGSSVTEFNGHSIIGTEFRDRILFYQNATYKFEGVGPQYSGFGYAHTLTNNWIIVGAPKINNRTGRVYLSKSINGQYQNNFSTYISALTPNAEDEYGKAVDVHGSWLVVGAPNTTTELHSGYIEIWKETNGVWARKQKIQPTGLSNTANYGFSVAIRGDRMVVGAPGERYIYIYKLVNDTWVQEQWYYPYNVTWAKDIFGNSTPGWNFGYDVDITDGLIIVGDPGARKAGILTKNSSNVWQLTHTLLPPASSGPYNSDQFGYSVAIQFNRAVVGAPYPATAGVRPNEGKVYLYTDNYQFKGHMYVGNNPTLSITGLGYSVAIDSDNVLGGAPYVNNLSSGVNSEGAVFRQPFYYVFQSGNLRTEDLEESSETLATTLYPNPTNIDKVTINTKEEVIAVEAISAQGASTALSVVNNVVNVSTLKSGIYNLNIKTASGNKLEKLIKE